MEPKAFLRRLFDFSFKTFIAIDMIKILYVIAIALAGLMGLGVLLFSAQGGAVGVIVGLILAPIVFFISVLSYRITLEIIVVLFRIAENTSIMAGRSDEDVAGGVELVDD